MQWKLFAIMADIITPWMLFAFNVTNARFVEPVLNGPFSTGSGSSGRLSALMAISLSRRFPENERRCIACATLFTSIAQLEEHKSGKKHIRKVAWLDKQSKKEKFRQESSSPNSKKASLPLRENQLKTGRKKRPAVTLR